MSDERNSFVVYPTGETVWYNTDNDGDYSIPDDVDLDGFVIARVTVKRERLWKRLWRKTWRVAAVTPGDDITEENSDETN